MSSGAAAGAVGGAAAAVVMYSVTEPLLRQALMVEDRRVHAGAGHEMAEPLVGRTMQVVGGMATTLVIGAIFGVVFSVVFARTRHRLPALTEHGRVMALAALGFVVFALAPQIKIPGNPPAVGDPATISHRTLIFTLTILLTLALVLALFNLDASLRDRLSIPVRSIVTVAAFAVGTSAILLLVPDSPDGIPTDMPTTLIWNFRLASLGQLATMWASLGLVFSVLIHRGRRQPRLHSLDPQRGGPHQA
ncbi:CbtA family protein [Nocardioides sp. W3-2-3]|uniref:CbtA family protein n=1 Tax=Nocardioides convexus TaxID=2712224 RepID=UPI0024186992|nr:CbtA family protein [Nocardioides convexus]NHA01301.1 CbtA family protein [Nocardioides convexus]